MLPEADEVEVQINQDEIRIDIFHSGGHGGQNVQKVATAVRIVHLPTGVTAICQDERSQLKNKTKAMAVLRARLYDAERRRQDAEITEARRAQVGTADRSEKIRTYNYPQNRITDHRLEVSAHNLPQFMDGDIDDMLDSLVAHDRARQLEGGGGRVTLRRRPRRRARAAPSGRRRRGAPRSRSARYGGGRYLPRTALCLAS